MFFSDDAPVPMVLKYIKRNPGLTSTLTLTYRGHSASINNDNAEDDDSETILQTRYEENDSGELMYTRMQYYSIYQDVQVNPNLPPFGSNVENIITHFFSKTNHNYRKWGGQYRHNEVHFETQCNKCRNGLWSINVTDKAVEQEVSVDHPEWLHRVEEERENDPVNNSMHPNCR